MVIEASCSIDGCEKPAEEGGLCRGHRARKQRKRTVNGELQERARTPFEGMVRAALAYRDELETLDDEEWARARDRFRAALKLAYRAYLKRLTGLDWPRAVRRESIGDGMVRLTFRTLPPPAKRKKSSGLA